MPESASDGQDLAGLIQELTARSVSEQARTLQRYRELVERVAAGQLDPETVRLQYDRLLAEQSAQFARDVATLGARYYEAVLELNGAYVERLFDRVAGAAGRPVTSTSRGPRGGRHSVAGGAHAGRHRGATVGRPSDREQARSRQTSSSCSPTTSDGGGRSARRSSSTRRAVRTLHRTASDP
jgi:hypothetical protein